MASRWTGSLPLTMSSREIADLLDKQHGNIKISAERLAEKGVIGTLAVQEFEHNGNTYTEYLLSKRDSLILVAQNSPEFTARIVDRWQELEAQQGPKLPTTMAESWCAQHSIRLPICLHGLPFGDVNLLVSPRR